MTRRIFVDTEWTQPPWSAESRLMWIGLADEDGHSWYGISSEVDIDPTTNRFISGVFKLITPDEPRMTNRALAQAVKDFCGDVDEFWAWVPAMDRVAEWFQLNEHEASRLYAEYWDIDVQALQSLITPWPEGWPDHLCDLNNAAAEAGVEIPPRAENHLHPRVHCEWNRELFRRILKQQSQSLR